ncbi:MAG: D-ribose ABC transporter substrate-binding protein [Steroidobacteraceae bacterium]
MTIREGCKRLRIPGRHWVGGGAVLCSLALLAACHSGSAGTGTSSMQPRRVAVVVSTLDNPYFVVLANTAAEEARRLGYQTTIFDSQDDPAEEASTFENIVAAGYSAILLNATDDQGSVSNARMAMQAHIPVFTMDRAIQSDQATVSQVVSDNYAGAVEVGQYFVRELNGHGRYVELLGLVGDNNTWIRSNGFHSVVGRYPGLKMVAQQSADFDRSRALSVMDSILQAHPEIDAVFCDNDTMALGAYQALLAAHLDHAVRVFGFDGSADGIAAIEAGHMDATAMQSPAVIARLAAQYADLYLRGDRALPPRVLVAVSLVTRANVARFIDGDHRSQR